MPKPVRRIVTGHNAAGKSVILMDGPAPDQLQSLFSPAYYSALIWETDRSPALNRGNEDTAPAGKRVPTPPRHRGGSVFRISDIPPDSAYGDTTKVDIAVQGAHTTAEGRKRHFLFHKTDTVDYAICLEGEIWAMMDEGEVLMKAGDVLVQRGTHHSWANRSDKMCRMAFILLDAEKLD
ncbi:MAG TPA: cupin domain-containing protein [Stellaceae bacterium]|nr:cupin domain-containing protein [Stellaceae bacterium]